MSAIGNRNSAGYRSRNFSRALGIKMPEPYPLEFPRILDFIPIHSLQAEIDGDQELFVYAGNVSVGMGKSTKREINKDHNLTITQSPSNRLHTAVKFGHVNNEQTTTQEDLWDEVQDLMGLDTKEQDSTVPDLSIRMRGLKNEVPYDVSDNPALSGIEYIYQIQSSRGNRTKSYRERFGLTHIINPSYMIKNELIERGYWDKRYGSKLRSILRTEAMLGGGEHRRIGWTELFTMPVESVQGDKNRRFPPLAGALNRSLVTDKWHWDYGIPSALTGKINSWDMNAVVYMLANRRVASVI